MDNDRRSAERQNQAGYTAVLCEACEPNDDLGVLDALSDSVSRSPHGVLVRSPCQLGKLWCHTRKNSRRTTGQVILVQPCDTRRRPLGPVILVGPIRTSADLADVTRWLKSTPTSAHGLPDRLHRPLRNPSPASPN
ncbi:hypothetical protein GCM10009854_48750 [Saccharopolyspora halophila]|uniref:Uncharacterized protein n=1 Tax=Saccharopolyspora halophila TaxID=405551 RepID=A0ABP5TWY6_9PSEU